MNTRNIGNEAKINPKTGRIDTHSPQTTKERNESMISVMDVLVIFLSGFISAKVCDYVHELEREENEA